MRAKAARGGKLEAVGQTTTGTKPCGESLAWVPWVTLEEDRATAARTMLRYSRGGTFGPCYGTVERVLLSDAAVQYGCLRRI